MDRYWLILFLLLCSCRATKDISREETFHGTHYEASTVSDTLSLERYISIIEIKGTRRIVTIFDTSLAKDTGGGFVAPVKAIIEEEIQDSLNTVCNDNVRSHRWEETSIRRQEDRHTQEREKREIGKSVSLGIGFIIFFVCVMFLLWKKISSR